MFGRSDIFSSAFVYENLLNFFRDSHHEGQSDIFDDKRFG